MNATNICPAGQIFVAFKNRVSLALLNFSCFVQENGLRGVLAVVRG